MKDMVLKNMIIRKCYFLLGIIMADNMFAVNEAIAMNKGKALHKNPNEIKPSIDTKKSTTGINTSQGFYIKYGKEYFTSDDNSSIKTN